MSTPTAAHGALPEAGEREAFERKFPVVGGVLWDGVGYVVSPSYENSYTADRFVGQWSAWQARAALSPASPAPAVPIGWKLVPVEPTPEMRSAIIRQMDLQETAWSYNPSAVYRDMLTAAPTPAQQPAPAVPLRGYMGSTPDGGFDDHDELGDDITPHEEAAEIIGNLIANIEKHGMYSMESTLGFLSQAFYCLRPANATPAQQTQSDAVAGAVPEGFDLVAVKKLNDLVDALDRAARKGYLPEALEQEWEAFEHRHIDPAALGQASGVALAQSDDEAFIRDLLWNEHRECCGCPEVGAEYMGLQEMVCCGMPEPAMLNDKQIVLTLRGRYPESATPPQQATPSAAASIKPDVRGEAS